MSLDPTRDLTGNASGDGEASGDDPIVRDPNREQLRIVAVASGKGGAGKSLVAANIAIFLATLNKRVVLLDADLGAANLHTFVGVDKSAPTLGDLLDKRVNHVDELVVETPITGLGLISGVQAPYWIANPSSAQKFRLFNQIQKVSADYLVMDLPSGSAFSALEFFVLADVGIMVVDPEPTSIENMHRFIKAAFLRRLRSENISLPPLLAADRAHEFQGGIPAPLDMVRDLEGGDEAQSSALLELIRTYRPCLVVNRVRARADIDLGQTLVTVARRRLGLELNYLGHLEHDDAVWVSVRKRRPLLVDQPDSRVARGIERITRRLLALEGEAGQTAFTALQEENHYQLLQIQPGAGEEDIRRGYRRVREIYGESSIVIAGLYEREELAALMQQLQSAYETLMDGDRRKAYDRQTFPEGLPPRERAATPVTDVPTLKAGPLVLGGLGVTEKKSSTPEKSAAERPPPPDLPPDTEYTGPILRQARQSLGVDLRALAEKTKIGVGYLRALEEERFDLLPAPVYVRGFLTEFGKALKVDVPRLLATYLERYKVAHMEMED